MNRERSVKVNELYYMKTIRAIGNVNSLLIMF